MFKTEVEYSNWLHRNCEACNRYDSCYYCPLRIALVQDYHEGNRACNFVAEKAGINEDGSLVINCKSKI